MSPCDSIPADRVGAKLKVWAPPQVLVPLSSGTVAPDVPVFCDAAVPKALLPNVDHSASSCVRSPLSVVPQLPLSAPTVGSVNPRLVVVVIRSCPLLN